MNAWLFSFVDLAFMLLIAFSQIQDQPLDKSIQYKNIQLAEIEKEEGVSTTTFQQGKNYYVEIDNHILDVAKAKPIFNLGFRAWDRGGKRLNNMEYMIQTSDIKIFNKQLVALYNEQYQNKNISLPVVIPDEKAYFQDIVSVNQAVKKIWRKIPSHTVKAGML